MIWLSGRSLKSQSIAILCAIFLAVWSGLVFAAPQPQGPTAALNTSSALLSTVGANSTTVNLASQVNKTSNGTDDASTDLTGRPIPVVSACTIVDWRPGNGEVADCRQAASGLPNHDVQFLFKTDSPWSQYRVPRTAMSGTCDIEISLPDNNDTEERSSWKIIQERLKEIIDDCVDVEKCLGGGQIRVGQHRRLLVSVTLHDLNNHLTRGWGSNVTTLDTPIIVNTTAAF